MAISVEYNERFDNHKTRDEVMLDIARYYIDTSGVETEEMIQLFHDIPCLNVGHHSSNHHASAR